MITNKKIHQEINERIRLGYQQRSKYGQAGGCEQFLDAWKLFLRYTPGDMKDFEEVVASQTEEEPYDWKAWIWEVAGDLMFAGSQHPKWYQELFDFINEFYRRFPDTDDDDLAEYLLRKRIKVCFLLGKDLEGEQSVIIFYEKIPWSVWGYIEWGDALLGQKKYHTRNELQRILKIYGRGLMLDDDEENLRILKQRIHQVQALVKAH